MPKSAVKSKPNVVTLGFEAQLFAADKLRGHLDAACRTAIENDFEQWLRTWLEEHGFKQEK